MRILITGDDARVARVEPRGVRGAAVAAVGCGLLGVARRPRRGRGRALVSQILLALDTATERTTVGVAQLDDERLEVFGLGGRRRAAGGHVAAAADDGVAARRSAA